MTKEVDAREKELTHQVHREMLIRSLEQVKNLTPVLISGIKVFITAKQTSKIYLYNCSHLTQIMKEKTRTLSPWSLSKDI